MKAKRTDIDYFNKIKQSKGITLIVLIVTIIVLLILAGITISSLTSEGLFTKVKRAKEEHEISAAEEALNMKLSSITINEEGKKDLNYLNGMTIEGYQTQVSEIGKLVTMTKNNENYYFLVDSNYNVQRLNNISGTIGNSIKAEGNAYIPLKILNRKIEGENTKLTMTLDINYTDNIESVEVYQESATGDKKVYSGTNLKFEVSVENNVQYQFYAIVKYKSTDKVKLAVEEKGEIWINIMEVIGIDYSKYNSKTEALSDSTVLKAIKNNVEALKLLTKDKEAFDIVCSKDTSIDDEVIKNGIVPQMTSNISATPFVVSATTEYGGCSPWYAFDRVVVSRSNFWHTDSSKPQEFKIDMGEMKEVSAFSLSSPDLKSAMPKKFTFEGSNNENDWTIIKEYKDFSDYTVLETTLFPLDETVKYRYYRFNISEDNGYSYVVISEIQFYN